MPSPSHECGCHAFSHFVSVLLRFGDSSLLINGLQVEDMMNNFAIEHLRNVDGKFADEAAVARALSYVSNQYNFGETS